MPIIKKYDTDFFKIWSHDMAYVLGFMYADGNLVKTTRGTHFIAIYSADHELLEQFKLLFKSEHSIHQRTTSSGKVSRIQIGSKEWFYDLQRIGLTPGKAKIMTLPKIPDAYIGDFIRGYFDGDGNVWSGQIHKNRQKQQKTLQVAFTSGSSGFLYDLHLLLSKKGVVGGSLYKSSKKNFSRLSFSLQAALTIYKIMYNGDHKLYLPRKKQVFEKFVNCGGSSTG